MKPALLYGSQGDTLLAIAWLWTVIATLLMILRTMSAALERSKERSSVFGLRYDFVCVVVAYVLALNATITTTDGLLKAAGEDQGLDTLSHVIYTGLIANTSALFAMSFGRLAVIALLLSLHSGTTYKSGRIALWAIGITQFIINCVQVGFTIHQCSPVRRLWEISIQGTCDYVEFNRKLGYFTGSFGAACDFFLAIYPAALIVGPLQGMKLSLKVAICFVMGGGVVAGIAGIVKTVQITNILHVSQNYAIVVVWILTETWFIIIFGSITTTKGVFVAIGRKLKLMSTGRSSKSAQRRPSGHADSSWVELSEPGFQSTGSTSRKEQYPVKAERMVSGDDVGWKEGFAGCQPLDRH